MVPSAVKPTVRPSADQNTVPAPAGTAPRSRAPSESSVRTRNTPSAMYAMREPSGDNASPDNAWNVLVPARARSPVISNRRTGTVAAGFAFQAAAPTAAASSTPAAATLKSARRLTPVAVGSTSDCAPGDSAIRASPMSRSRCRGSRSRQRASNRRNARWHCRWQPVQARNILEHRRERVRDVFAVEQARSRSAFRRARPERPDVGRACRPSLPFACSGLM